MGVTQLDGTLTIGPANQMDGCFPSSSASLVLQTKPNPKQANVSTSTQKRSVSVPSPNWQTLSGIGPTDTVTQADFLYFRCDAQVKLRLSTTDPANPGGAAIVSILPVFGLVLWEFPPSNGCLLLLEIQGSATVEYAASGSL